MTAPTPATVALVLERDQGRCAYCGDPIRGNRGIDYSIHHRTPRAMGGSKEKWINLPGNLIPLHGTGTQGCHSVLESERIAAQEAGFIVRHGITKPVNVPIQHATHGLCLLTDDGRVIPQTPEEVKF